MEQEQEIKKLRNELFKLSRDYCQFRIMTFYRSIGVAIALLLGLIIGCLL